MEYERLEASGEGNSWVQGGGEALTGHPSEPAKVLPTEQKTNYWKEGTFLCCTSLVSNTSFPDPHHSTSANQGIAQAAANPGPHAVGGGGYFLAQAHGEMLAVPESYLCSPA